MRLLGENGSRKFRIMRDNIIKNVSVLGENLQRGTPKKLISLVAQFFSWYNFFSVDRAFIYQGL